LGLIAFSQELFIRGGIEQQKVVGLPATEAMALFLENDVRRVRRILRLVLARRGALVAGCAHASHRNFDALKTFHRREALRTVTMLGVLLHKLGRLAGTPGSRTNTPEDYMNDVAFKLGQLLAAADVVHAGYCADVRGGDLPPSLLGNQVFVMAQTDPAKALGVLCRRWKPYDGWAQRASREAERVERFKEGAAQRYWDIRRAIRHAREMRPLAAELREAVVKGGLNDAFRAELLLGYIAGLPKAQKEEAGVTDQDVAENRD
jgi:hypothetical protein